MQLPADVPPVAALPPPVAHGGHGPDAGMSQLPLLPLAAVPLPALAQGGHGPDVGITQAPLLVPPLAAPPPPVAHGGHGPEVGITQEPLLAEPDPPLFAAAPPPLVAHGGHGPESGITQPELGTGDTRITGTSTTGLGVLVGETIVGTPVGAKNGSPPPPPPPEEGAGVRVGIVCALSSVAFGRKTNNPSNKLNNTNKLNCFFNID